MTDPPRRPGQTRELAAACFAVLAGGAAALLAGSRPWDRVTVTRAAPLAPFTVAVDGRTVVPAVAGLAVVALAGVIALLATRGRARAAMGVVLALTGALLAWQAATGFAPVSATRARSLVADARTGVVLERGQSIRVDTVAGWAVAALLGALLVFGGGVLIAVRGAAWSSMSGRYEVPGRPPVQPAGPVRPVAAADADAERARADLALWQSLERGEDPTAPPEQ